MNFYYDLFGYIFYIYFLTYIGLGFVQPLGAICRIIAAKRSNSTYAIGLKKYLLAVVIYFLVICGLAEIDQFKGSIFNTFYLFILPWAFAIWYMRHNWIWKKKRKNIIAYDKMKKLQAPHEDRVILDSYPKKRFNPKPILDYKKKERIHSNRTIIRKLPLMALSK